MLYSQTNTVSFHVPDEYLKSIEYENNLKELEIDYHKSETTEYIMFFITFNRVVDLEVLSNV